MMWALFWFFVGGLWTSMVGDLLGYGELMPLAWTCWGAALVTLVCARSLRS